VAFWPRPPQAQGLGSEGQGSILARVQLNSTVLGESLRVCRPLFAALKIRGQCYELAASMP